MFENKENKKSIQNKLSTVKYNCDKVSHLKIDNEKCSKCTEKTCTFICPANVYSLDENSGEILLQYENCLECGACRIACPYGTIEWEYPKGSHGVIFKNN